VEAKLSRLQGRHRGLSVDERSLVGTRINALTARTEAEPKDMRWRARAKTDSRVEWYKDASGKEAAF
jgi:hypothetical protein